MDYFKPKAINRLTLPFQALDVKDTTITHVRYQEALKHAKETLVMLRFVNLSLSIFAALAGVYFLFNFVFGQQMVRNSFSVAEAGVNVPNNNRAFDLPHLPDFSVYQEMLARRSIFEPVPLETAARQEAMEMAKMELEQKFRVIGVFIDSEPKAIIEMAGSGETVFVREGESAEGAVVKKILEDGVTVLYNNIELELKR